MVQFVLDNIQKGRVVNQVVFVTDEDGKFVYETLILGGYTTLTINLIFI